MMMGMGVEENNEVFCGGEGHGPARASSSSSSSSPISLVRRWPIVYHGPATTAGGSGEGGEAVKHWCGRGGGRGGAHRAQVRHVEVRLEAVEDASVICPIAQEAIVDADRDASFFPPGVTYSQSVPALNAVVLGCEHRFSVLHLLYHWVRNATVRCPVCRRGIENAHLRHSTLPTHLRSGLLARTRLERRKDKEEALREDMELARSLALQQLTTMTMTAMGDVHYWLGEAPRRFVPALGTFDPGDVPPLHVIMGFTVPLVDHTTSRVLLSRSGIITSSALPWGAAAYGGQGRWPMSDDARSRVHQALIRTAFGQVPQGVMAAADEGPVRAPATLLELGGEDYQTDPNFALFANVVYVDAFFRVVPWCLGRVPSVCLELFLERPAAPLVEEEGVGNGGGGGGRGGANEGRRARDVVALITKERMAVSFGSRAGMWVARGGARAAMVAEMPHRGGEEEEEVVDGGDVAMRSYRLDPPLLVYQRQTGDAGDGVPSMGMPEEEEAAAAAAAISMDGTFENEEVARILFAGSPRGEGGPPLPVGHPFRVAGGMYAMRFPPSELLDPSSISQQEADGLLVDLTPAPRGDDAPIRYLVRMQGGAVAEVFFEVRLDVFCLMALEQEHVRQTAMLRVVPESVE